MWSLCFRASEKDFVRATTGKRRKYTSPNFKLTLPLLLDNCRQETLVWGWTHLSAGPRALWASPMAHNLRGEKSFEPELWAAWLAAWAVVVCFKQRILKGKHGQTKPRLKTQEARGADARLVRMRSTARPSRHQAATARKGGGGGGLGVLPGNLGSLLLLLLGSLLAGEHVTGSGSKSRRSSSCCAAQPGLHDAHTNKQTKKQANKCQINKTKKSNKETDKQNTNKRK